MADSLPAARILDVPSAHELTADLPFRLGRGRMVVWRDRLIFAWHRILEPAPAGSFLTDQDAFGAAALVPAKKFAVEECPLPLKFPALPTWARDTKRTFWLALADDQGSPVFVLNSPASGGSDRKSANFAYVLDPSTSTWFRLCRAEPGDILLRGVEADAADEPSPFVLSERDVLLWKDDAGKLRFARAELVEKHGEQWIEARLGAVQAARRWERRDPAPDLVAWPADKDPDGDWYLNDLVEDETILKGRVPKYRIGGLAAFVAAPDRLSRRRQTRVTEILRGVPLETPAGPKLLLFVRHWTRTAAGSPRDSVLVLRDTWPIPYEPR